MGLTIYIFFDLEEPPKIDIFDLYFKYVKELLSNDVENSIEIWNFYKSKIHQVDFIQRIYRLSQFKLNAVSDHQCNMEHYLKLIFQKDR